MKALRHIALLLILSTLFSALIGCKPTSITLESNSTDTTTESVANNTEGTVKATDKQTETIEDEEEQNENNKIILFKDGEYVAKIIRSDAPTTLDSDIYNNVKKLFKDTLGVNPTTNTDYTVSGEERYDGPAILVGKTEYQESKDEIAKLSQNSASARLIGNKYVIVYSDEEAAQMLLNQLMAKIEMYADHDNFTIDSEWEITVSTAPDDSNDNQTFDDTGLTNSATLPKFNGETLINPLYAGQSSNIYIQKNANLDNFNTFCEDLASAGFRYYTDNSINNNKFATYVTQTQIVHVMYFKVKNEVRIAVDKRGSGKSGFALPALSGENAYTKTTEPSLTMVEIDNTGYGGGMCFIYKLSNGKFFIIDSGVNASGSRLSSAQWIYKTLKKLAGSEKIVVAAWLITHVHSDHLGGLHDMANDSSITSNLTIEQLVHNEPADEVTQALDGLSPSSSNNIWAWMNPIIQAFNIQSVIKAHPGQVLHYADAKVTVLASQDISLDQQASLKDSNDVSVVTQVEFNGKKILMLGDAIKKQNAFMAEVYGTALKSDILQVTHHGLNESGADTAEGDPNSVNQLCAPSITLWPAGYDSCHQDRDKYDYALSVKLNAYLVNNTVKYGARDGNVTFDENWNAKTNYPSF